MTQLSSLEDDLNTHRRSLNELAIDAVALKKKSEQARAKLARMARSETAKVSATVIELRWIRWLVVQLLGRAVPSEGITVRGASQNDHSHSQTLSQRLRQQQLENNDEDFSALMSQTKNSNSVPVAPSSNTFSFGTSSNAIKAPIPKQRRRPSPPVQQQMQQQIKQDVFPPLQQTLAFGEIQQMINDDEDDLFSNE